MLEVGVGGLVVGVIKVGEEGVGELNAGLLGGLLGEGSWRVGISFRDFWG
jgi:hypothetical protein